jgi:hypothetical protein
MATGTQQKAWEESYRDLRALVEADSSISVAQGALSFGDAEAKQAFYGHLDAMASALVDEYLAPVPGLLRTPAQRLFDEVEASLRARAGIVQIELSRTLDDYRHDPRSTAAHLLFDASIRLLQGRMDHTGLVDFVTGRIPAHLAETDRYLYEAWVAYGIVELLGPVGFHAVQGTEEGAFEARPTDRIVLGSQPPSRDYRLPEALFVTASGACFAYKYEHSTEIVSYRQPCRTRDFTSAGNTARQVCHRVLLLYEVEGPATVPVIAQRSKKSMRAPDLMVEHLSSLEYASLDKRQEVRSRSELADCPRPTQVVLREAQPDVRLGPKEAGPRAFATRVVGYERTALAAVLVPLQAS